MKINEKWALKRLFRGIFLFLIFIGVIDYLFILVKLDEIFLTKEKFIGF